MKRLLARVRDSRGAALPEYALVFSVMAASMVGVYQLLEDRGSEVIASDASNIGQLPRTDSLSDAQTAAGPPPTSTTTTTTAPPPSSTSSTSSTSTTSTTTTTIAPTAVADLFIVDVSPPPFVDGHGRDSREPKIDVYVNDEFGNPRVGARVKVEVVSDYGAGDYFDWTNGSGKAHIDVSAYHWHFEYPVTFIVKWVKVDGVKIPLTGVTTFTINTI
ncbi:MAG: hypothetical protein HKN26_14875 [Acidimicrobiales bacterium]|nr:hypothetical protein [Acidimicrobiales bacterium]